MKIFDWDLRLKITVCNGRSESVQKSKGENTKKHRAPCINFAGGVLESSYRLKIQLSGVCESSRAAEFDSEGLY